MKNKVERFKSFLERNKIFFEVYNFGLLDQINMETDDENKILDKIHNDIIVERLKK